MQATLIRAGAPPLRPRRRRRLFVAVDEDAADRVSMEDSSVTMPSALFL